MSDVSDICIRKMEAHDQQFIMSLSPTLAGVAELEWHPSEVIQKFQDSYIEEMMAETDVRHSTFVAESAGVAVGFIHIRERQDEVSGEDIGTVPLLAVKEDMQGRGIGRRLIHAAEEWSSAQGFRLVHLEVFASNRGGQDFYKELGFQAETINMIKPID